MRPLEDRGPLRVMFVLTSMPVGGAETLLVNLVRRLDRDRFVPEICCLKERGELGDVLAAELPVHERLIGGKFDVFVWRRLTRLFRERRIDAVVTVGAGDKMFWGRLAAWSAGVPVIASALHSTGWPDVIQRPNRWLTGLTDAFIGVAPPHGRYLIEQERFPADKVHVIPNGIDVQRFRPQPELRAAGRAALGIAPDAPVCGIVAALRPEKNHRLFLQTAALVRKQLPLARFVIVGDGAERPQLERAAQEPALGDSVLFLGTRSDIPEQLATWDLFALTSHMEANPVSILEALACGVPVVAPRVGSIPETVREGETGFLAAPGDAEALARHWIAVLSDPELGARLGRQGREHVVAHGSLESMVTGYETLLESIYRRKANRGQGRRRTSAVHDTLPA